MDIRLEKMEELLDWRDELIENQDNSEETSKRIESIDNELDNLWFYLTQQFNDPNKTTAERIYALKNYVSTEKPGLQERYQETYRGGERIPEYAKVILRKAFEEIRNRQE